MKITHDLSKLNWKLSGWTPHLWRMQQTMEIGASPDSEVSAISAKVPGSVQYALRKARILPDWNVGLNYRECEWVENRHWIYETVIPDELIEEGKTHRLNCQGLDYCGCIIVNGQIVSEFCGSHVPYSFDITSYLRESGNVIRIVFENPPRWLGQFGFTSQMKEWKVRFNYTWDWVIRLVQIGIWDSVTLEVTDGRCIENFSCVTDADYQASTGILECKGSVNAPDGAVVKISLAKDSQPLAEWEIPADKFNTDGFSVSEFPVELWWTNMTGAQPLYTVCCTLLDKDGNPLDNMSRRVGFKHVDWERCEGAPEQAYPWICRINGKRIFLQGINWVPILPNFADVEYKDYEKRLHLYKDLGLNIMRVWGGASLEREMFYDLCDELGLLVWQEFPMSSSGIDNWPPDDEKSVEEMAAIAKTYITRRQHHVSLIIWCSGNELQGGMNGEKVSGGKPVDDSHPMIARLKQVVMRNDPRRRFLFTSPSGPVFFATPENFGKGMHWHVHGPWKADGALEVHWKSYWAGDDSMLRSETGAPGTSSVELIKKYAGALNLVPISADNPLWKRTSVWWLDREVFAAENGHDPETLEEYVAWSQERQKKALTIALSACKSRFPRCGGFIVWMGHDCFPCVANTSIVDFEGNPKPAALALSEIWRKPVEA